MPAKTAPAEAPKTGGNGKDEKGEEVASSADVIGAFSFLTFVAVSKSTRPHAVM